MFDWLRNRRNPVRERWALDTPLFRWDERGRDVFTIGNSYCGFLCLGGTGSGKSSVTARMLALSMLSAGYGGLVLSVKRELPVWQEYCRMTQRVADLRVVDHTCRDCAFNFLDELVTYQGGDVGLTENIVSLFMEIGSIGSRHGGSKGDAQGDNQFFHLATKELLRNLISLLILATGRVSIPDLCRLVSVLPRTPDNVASAKWRESNWCFQLLHALDTQPKPPSQQHDYEAILNYICYGFPNLAPRTQSSIAATFSGMADLFQRGLLHQLHSQGTSLSPRAIDNGAVIVLDLPLKTYGDVGLYCQLVWKMMTQNYLERRPVDANTTPAFIFIDEAQFFASQQADALFASTCRASRVANVLISQSVSGFETAFGSGAMGKALAEQLFANLSTKVIHATSDNGTAEWASNLIGKNYRLLGNSSCSQGPGGVDWAAMAGIGPSSQQTSSGFSESLQYDVEPSEFAYLRTGGLENGLLVDGIAIRSGRPFQCTGKTWMPVTFSQQ